MTLVPRRTKATILFPAPPTPTMGQWLIGDAKRLSIRTGLLTVLAYVFLRTASDIFYAPLGVAPEDVGIDKAEILARAAGLVVLTTVIAIMLGATAFEFVALFAAKPSKNGELHPEEAAARQQSRFHLAIIAAVVALLLIAPVWGVAIAVQVLLFVALAGWWLYLVVAGAGQFWRTPATRLWRVGSAAFGVVVLAFAVALLYRPALAGSGNALAGRGLAGLERVMLPWEATVAEIEWTGTSLPPHAIAELKCGVYLGTSSATAVIVNPDPDPESERRSVLRIPAGNLVIRTHTAKNGREPFCGKAGVEY